MNNKKLIKAVAMSLFGLMVMMVISTIFVFSPHSIYADGGVCYDCFQWHKNVWECGFDHFGSTGCRQSNYRCELTGVACNNPPAY